MTLREVIANSQAEITQFRYTLIVTGTDNGACCGSNVRNTGTGTLTVNILTENEFRPSFDICRNLSPQVREEQANARVVQVGVLCQFHEQN